MNQKDKVISILLAEDGYLEKKSNKNLDDKTANAGANNYTRYSRDLDALKTFYNGPKQGFAWCDVFVDWGFVKAFGVEEAKRLLCQPSKSCGAGVGYSANYYKAKGQFHESQPQAGDQIFFKDSKGNVVHTGLVYQVDNLYVYTIEGNTSSDSGVIPNGGCVKKKKYPLNYRYIYGYGRPDYKVESKPVESVKEEIKFVEGATYKVLKAKYMRRTPVVADNKIKYNNLVYATQRQCTKDSKGYAKYKIGTKLKLSKFQKDYKGNIWGMYKGVYSSVWLCVHDSTGYQVEKV